ncbi:MAG TPA: SDR family oxidoreductase [Candidatus Saccharimonadales bacterium]|nr:SDR family oxidoreductase [Candidatus Saccharimonadales bacterium]
MTSRGWNKTALITGASGGIGLELATICAEHGHDLVLVARSHERLGAIAADLRHVYNINVLSIEQDLAKKGAAAKIMQELEDNKIELEILINNAGFGHREAIADADIKRGLDMIQVNAAVLTELTALVVSGMVKRGNGRVLNVASTAAFAPGPFMAVYHATKAYVLSFSQAIHQELKGSGVIVTALCPGPTVTHWAASAGVNVAKFNARAMSAHEVAKEGYGAMMAGRRVVIAGGKNKWRIGLLRFVPTGVALKNFSWRRGR